MSRPQFGHYLSDIGLVWGGISWVLLVAVDKKYLAHLLIINYGKMKGLVCEKLFSDNIIFMGESQDCPMLIPINANPQ